MQKILRQFLQMESASGLLLFTMAALAMVWANSPLAALHQHFVRFSIFAVNEVLMSLFFLLVTLELKRHYIEGRLSLKTATLPAFAAFGGMLVPALVYIALNYKHPLALRGWPTPVATDIAFALGVLSLFGRRVPLALKLFLLSLAIFDDIGAILIIGFFYSQNISLIFLGLAVWIVLLLYFCEAFKTRFLTLPVYLFLGTLLWFFLFKGGVHATIAGVLLGLFIPSASSVPDKKKKVKMNPSLLHRLEKNLHPWVAFLIMPLFALTNAGFSIHNVTIQHMTGSVVCGIVAGLFIGKQVGVFGFSWVLIKCQFAQLPEKVSWAEMYSIAVLCGIGFTMSLFLGTLSFQNENIYLGEVRMGVIMGTLCSGVIGALLLEIVLPKKISRRNP